jgi:hypothetical protein
MEGGREGTESYVGSYRLGVGLACQMVEVGDRL